MNTLIKVLPAYDGDCLIIKFGEVENRKNILIDGGRGVFTYNLLKKEIKAITDCNEFIDLVIVTHIDRDHILGLITIFKDNNISKEVFKRVWFNSGRKLLNYFNQEVIDSRDILINMNPEVSVNQGITFEKLLETFSLYDDMVIVSDKKHSIENSELIILSPDCESLSKLNKTWQVESGDLESTASAKINTEYEISLDELSKKKFNEDVSIPNGSSIAFLFIYDNKKILMLGDSHPSVIEKELRVLGYSDSNKLIVNAIKISHHGSKYNTSTSLLELIDCENFIISTNGRFHGLPNKECLSRIISTRKFSRLFFNYKVFGSIFTEQDKEKYKFECIYLGDTNFILEV